jgi:metallo-beta-lactamase family protein
LAVENSSILIECGMFLGVSDNEQRNNDEFPFSVEELDAVIISYTHLDHSGRSPLLIKAGYIYIMLW